MATALADDGPHGDRCRRRLRQEELGAPELLDLEVISVYRRLLARGGIDLRRASLAIHDLMDLPLQRFPHRWFLPRCWDLRENLTVYDAAYVALAEALDTVLVTADARLSRAPGLRCRVEVMV